MGRPRMAFADRLRDKYIPEPMSGCWLWLGRVDRHGYGLVGIFNDGKSRNTGAHRISWIAHRGDIPAGMWILHDCDNPACINPDHLYVGTPADNASDRVRRNRQGRTGLPGEKHPMAKLCWADVNSIRARARGGEALAGIAAEYRVSRRAVCEIVLGKCWDDPGYTPPRPRAIAKLSEREVQLIRAERAAGATTHELAQRYGVSQSTVSRVSTMKTWKAVQQCHT